MRSPASLYSLARLTARLCGAGFLERARRHTVEERLAALPSQSLPVADRVDIRWNEHLIPFIEAASDRDLAVTLGLVHAHLRLAQMELLRRLAQGRLAEILGPIAVPIDHALRLLDPMRAVPAILSALPDETRDWLDGFVLGINHWLQSPAERPLEFRLLGIDPAPWTVEDVLGVARLAAADVNWLVWMRLLSQRQAAQSPEIWRRLIAEEAPLPGQVAGLMIPGIPMMAIGRNPWIAWGGTNLHAASSELFDVTALPADAIVERRIRLAVRWSQPRELTLRDSEYGPIISDAPLFGGRRPDRTLALRWVGHSPSDEITALLAINRARDWAAFRQAAEGFAIPGQTLVYADRDGHVGRLLAAWLPHRNASPPSELVSGVDNATAWSHLARSSELPVECDPPRGFVAAANERPPAASLPIGWFFSPDDRVRRLAALINGERRLGRAELASIQQDTKSCTALALRDRLRGLIEAAPDRSGLIAAFASWDGRYDPDSPGALAFELVLQRLATAVTNAERRAHYSAVWNARHLLARDITAVRPDRLAHLLRAALAQAAPAFGRLRCWGAAHRLRLAHPLAAIPLTGRRYRYGDFPWPGGNNTVMNSPHPLIAGRHAVAYGSNARYIFDLSHLDENYLVLLGGQDGAPGSAAFADQVAMFQRGESIRVPLDPATIRREFSRQTVIEPHRG